MDLKDKEVVIVGAGKLVGGPLAKMITERKPATLTICTKNTKDLHLYTTKADVIITAAGVPYLITKDMVKEGVIIIDAGINKVLVPGS